MELKPSKGLKVKVNAQREAIFGEEAVSVQRIMISDGGRLGVLTGRTLIGFCEVEMHGLDGRNHWYPIDDLVGEHGEKIAEEEIPMAMDEEGEEDSEEEQA